MTAGLPSTAPPASAASLRLALSEPAAPPPRLDADQARAVAWPRDAGHLLVVGAPGTGKTTVAVESFLARAGESPGEVLLLVPSRRGAARVQDVVAARLGLTTTGVHVQTPAAFAHAVLRHRARLLGEPDPTLITGPEQDRIIADLLAGHRAGAGAQVRWPDRLVAERPDGAGTLTLRAFRDELRDLFMRAAELGLGPQELAERGERHDRPEWVAAATLLQEYQDVTTLGELTADRGARLDSARLVDEATEALRAWEHELPGHPRPRWSAVVVDDHQDSTLATARLLRVLADDGAQLLLHGDPDAGVQGFRGGTAALIGLAETRDPLGGFAAERIELKAAHRHDPRLRRAVAAVTGAISAAGTAGHRRAVAARAAEDVRPCGVDAAVLRSRPQEGAWLARRLREEHLRHGTPWSQMAVIARSAGHVRELQRTLRAWRVPTGGQAGPGVLREEPAVRPLLTAMEAVLTGGPTPEEAAELVTSPLGGVDAVAMRALRRALRGIERARGQTGRPVDELLAEVLRDPARASALPSAAGAAGRAAARVAAVLAAGREAADREGATAETVLWSLWDATGLAERWRERALAGGPGAERADADLDAVMALFRAAEQYTDRAVGSGPAGFLEHLRSQDLPADTLAAHGERRESVQVLTPAGAAGEEWQVVAVAGLQEEAWPDLRLRDCLLGAGTLAELEAGRTPESDSERTYAAARRAVLDDELRMLAVAVSRATRCLLVTAVLDEETRPSTFFDLLAPDHDPSRVEDVPPPLDLRGLVAELRAALESPRTPAARRQEAAALLAHLADEGVAGADPAEWAALAAESTTSPLQAPEDPVPVSPSGVESATTCGLRWALEQAGGRIAPSADQAVGNLIHEIASEHPHGTLEELREALDRRWAELSLESGETWVGRRRRQHAERMIERLAAYLAEVPGDVEVERSFAVDVGRARLKGRIDRVEHLSDGSDGAPEVRVVDLKTGKTPVSQGDAERHPQLGAYQVAVDAGAWGPVRSAGARLIYLGTGKGGAAERNQGALNGAEDPQWAQRMLIEAAETMGAATFLATLNDTCRTCPVRTSCPLQEDGGRVT